MATHLQHLPTPATGLFSYRRHWAHRLTPAPFLPMSPAEMAALNWEACDIILVTGDAYVDHPSFGMALIGRVLEAQGFRVGVIAQPDWTDSRAFKRLGQPKLFFGVTSGNMDSMVNRYTAERRRRSDDAYSPNGQPDHRPDRAAIVYSQRCREAYKAVPIVLGGIEASLRRTAHYDYWSDTIRRSILMDAKADLLLYGNAERAIVALAHRLACGEAMGDILDLRGTVFARSHLPADWAIADAREPETPPLTPATAQSLTREQIALRLPDYEQVKTDPVYYAHAARLAQLEANPGNARPLVQRHGNREVWLNPPPIPLSTPELDRMFELPYARRPHPSYGEASIPAFEMIKHSVNIMRGCFGGCSFCSITEHEGRIIQNRSVESILREVEAIRDQTPGFTGIITDLGGPTANMWRLHCKDPAVQARCRRLSCLYPGICANLETDQHPLIDLYRRVSALPGIKRVFIASGLRYDLAIETPAYVKELVTRHVGGYLKIAPEHTEPGPLSKMMKPDLRSYQRFRELFERYSKQAGKEQYLIPYFIAAHPGTTDKDMLHLALWLKRNHYRLDQVQAFLPTPMAVATTMYHTQRNPLRRIRRDGDKVYIPKGQRQRRLHKAFLRYHDPENWPLLREALKRLGRADLIGNGKKHLVPSYQPRGTGKQPEGVRTPKGKPYRKNNPPRTASQKG